jgi:hypothetical protein
MLSPTSERALMRQRRIIGCETGLGVQVLEVDSVVHHSHGPFNGGGVPGALVDIACLDTLLAGCEWDAEVRDVAAILNEALWALWRRGQCTAMVAAHAVDLFQRMPKSFYTRITKNVG